MALIDLGDDAGGLRRLGLRRISPSQSRRLSLAHELFLAVSDALSDGIEVGGVVIPAQAGI
jgi:hypothetical protein